MSFCPNCGKELAEGAHFCSSCGHGLRSAAPAARQSRTAGARRLHCPNCHSTVLSPVVETEISGGMSLNHSFSRKNSVSAMEFQNTHRNYWMCGECGHKFRNLQNLEEEIQKLQKAVKSAVIGVVLVAALILLLTVVNGFSPVLIFLIPALLFIICLIPITNRRIEKMEKEKAYLKKNCFG